MMDDFCAPQWTDFTKSPQVPSDDYFDKIHEVHEPQYYRQVETGKSMEPCTSDEFFGNDLSVVKSTPIKVISPNSRSQNVIIKETTYDNVLCQAMKNLELSLRKKKVRRSVMNESVPKTPTTRVLRSATRNSTKKVLDGSDVFKTPKTYDAQTVAEKTLNESGIYKTPKAQVTHSSPKKIISHSSDSQKLEAVQHVQDIVQEIRENELDVQTGAVESAEIERPHSNVQMQQEERSAAQAALVVKVGDDHEIDKDDHADFQNNADKENQALTEKKYKVPTNLVTSFKKRQSNNTEKERRSQGGQGKVLAGQYCQYRRRSIMKMRRLSNKYVSLAESVSKFQSGTPKRFRSVSNKALKPPAVTKLRRSSLKLTVPISPTLRSKARTRPITALSQEQREVLELEEIKKHPIKANPVNINVLKGPQHLKKPEKKPITVPEPFDLTESHKMHTTSTSNLQESLYDHDWITKIASSTMLANGLTSEKTDTVPEPVSTTNTKKTRIPSCSSESGRHAIPKKNMVPSIVVTDEMSVAVKNEEVLFFGIPVHATQKKSTHIVPFSFESRNKELQKRKEEKLKQLHEQTTNKFKTEFRAKPAPHFSKSASQVKDVPKKCSSIACPASFEERNNLLLKKKEEHVKQMIQEERNSRVFHAQPAPEFKPVVVHGLSNEKKHKEKTVNNQKKSTNIKSKVDVLQKSKDLNNMSRRTISGVSKVNENAEKCNPKTSLDFHKENVIAENKPNTDQENKPPNIMGYHVNDQAKTEKFVKDKKVVPPELNTNKRMKQRQQFEEKLKQKELEEEQRRQKAEEKRLAKEKAEIVLLRKQAETKARPMPVYKPLVLAKSTKPLTNPQSPAFTFKMKQRVLATRVENQA